MPTVKYYNPATSQWELIGVGNIGPTGPTGPTGPNAGIPYVFSTITTKADPGTGNFRFNNGIASSTTQIYISESANGGANAVNFLAALDDSTSTTKGILTFTNAANEQIIFSVTGTVVDEGNYQTIPVSWISGGLPANLQLNYLTFSRTGDIGATGPTGATGATGPTGASGQSTFVIALSDETTSLTTGTAIVTMRAPYAFSITSIPRASLTSASTSGNPTIDINVGGTSILGANKLSIDANELTSTTAATATTLASNPTNVADDAQITFDIDVAGTSARGLKVTIFHTRS